MGEQNASSIMSSNYGGLPQATQTTTTSSLTRVVRQEGERGGGC